MKKLTYLLSISLFFLSCSSSNNKNVQNNDISTSNQEQTIAEEQNNKVENFDLEVGEDETEPNYKTAADNNDYKLFTNQRFHFSVEIPNKWKALDKSKNGDGYYIYFITPSKQEIDIRVFGEKIDEELKDIIDQDCIELSSFSFNDKHQGSKCIGKDYMNLFRESNGVRIQLYVGNVLALNQEQLDELINIAKTLKFTHNNKENEV